MEKPWPPELTQEEENIVKMPFLVRGPSNEVPVHGLSSVFVTIGVQ